MNILTGSQIREADFRTMNYEPVSSICLMERAASGIADAVRNEADIRSETGLAVPDNTAVVVFCGKGNNAGDGYAVARLLSDCTDMSVVRVFPENEMTPECRENFRRLPSSVRILSLDDSYSECKQAKKNLFLIDALSGTGIKGRPRGAVSVAVKAINAVRQSCSRAVTISVDLPSGLPSEPYEDIDLEYDAVQADITLTIEFPKLSLLYPSTGRYAGKVKVIPIGLDRNFINNNASGFEWTDNGMLAAIMPERNEFGHKGDFGHLLVVAGSETMMGAAILCTAGALRSGCGLVTAHIPYCERQAMYAANPSAMTSPDRGKCFSEIPRDMGKYSAVTAGPGLGRAPETVRALKELMSASDKMVLDADALNIISDNPDLFSLIPSGSILTPHIGELKRLLKAFYGLGKEEEAWKSEKDKTEKAKGLASALKSAVIVKGAHTMVCCPDGRVVFNMTGNPGMAKGGSGDILSGLAGGLLARGIGTADAAILGVWLHGRAGDKAAAKFGYEAMNSSDILPEINF